MRDRVICEVPDDHEGVYFCSLNCKAYWHGVRRERFDGTPITHRDTR